MLLNCFTLLTIVIAMDVEGSPKMSCYKVLPYKMR